jgi:hypothetical protein
VRILGEFKPASGWRYRWNLWASRFATMVLWCSDCFAICCDGGLTHRQRIDLSCSKLQNDQSHSCHQYFWKTSAHQILRTQGMSKQAMNRIGSVVSWMNFHLGRRWATNYYSRNISSEQPQVLQELTLNSRWFPSVQRACAIS